MNTPAPHVRTPPVPAFAVTAGFFLALGVWVAACVGRWPTLSVPSPILAGVLLGVMLAGAMLAGTISLRHAVGTLLVAGLVNVLLVGSVVGAQSQAGVIGTAAEQPNRITMSGFIWIPGSLLAALVIGVAGGVLASPLRTGIRHRQWLLDFMGSPAGLAGAAILTTLCLIALGGFVTSAEAGLAVPDWPNSYQYNMFLFPFTKMVGGIFYEHAHRLVGSLAGLETLILTIWVFASRSAPVRTCRWLAALTLLLVIGQGVLGGARVFMFEHWGDQGTRVLALIHACTAQVFLFTLGCLAFFLATSRPARISLCDQPVYCGITPRRALALALPLALLIQTLAGALLRQMNWAPGLHLHLTNLLLVIPLIILTTKWARLPETNPINRAPALIRIGMHAVMGLQLLLGAYSWWITEKYTPDEQIASLGLSAVTAGHVVGGALLVLLAALLAMRFCLPVPTSEPRSAA